MVDIENNEAEVKETGKKGKGKKGKLPSLVANRTMSLDDIFIESGQMGLDLCTTNGRGVPLGGFITMWGEPGFGKSTIFADCARRLLAKYKRLNVPFKVLYIDIEGSKNLFKSLGLQEFIDDGTLIYIEGETVTYNKLGEIYDSILDGEEFMKDVKIIIVDSICNVTTEGKEDGEIEKADYGVIAKAAKEFYRRYTPKTQGKITTFLVNQVAANQDAGLFGPKFKQASSEASLHYPHIIIHAQKKVSKSEGDIKESIVKTINDASEKDKRSVEKKGFIVTLSTFNEAKKLKNRFGQIPDVDILVYRGQGAINAKTLKDLLLSYKFVVPNGNNTAFTVADELNIEEREKDKKYTSKELNTWIRTNTGKIVEFLKSVGMYKAKLDFKCPELLAFLDANESFREKLGYVEEDFDGYGGV